MDFNALVGSLTDHPAAAIAALAISACAYLFKALQEANAKTLELSMKIGPLAEQLSKSVDAVERILSKGQS